MLYIHETGVDADGVALPYHLESYDVDQTDGVGMMHLSELIPDYSVLTGTHKISVKTRRRPMEAQATKGPYTFNSSTEKISVRAKFRQAAIKLEGTAVGTNFRMGFWNATTKQHGKR